MLRKTVEIMSPAGDFVCLDAALDAGADSVYFGLKGTNMRAGARNFEVSDLKKIVRKCSYANAKSCLALNTIYYDGEFCEVRKILRAAKRAGVRAVIAWDFSVLRFAREVGIPVYLSTQASISNSASVAELFEKFGVCRFVLARECSLDDIAKIRFGLKKLLGTKAASEIEFEVFAHGAMCVSISGRCFMSQFLYGKSANRGECLQPCRRAYLLSDAESPDGGAKLDMRPDCVLSPKDLCTLPFVEKIFRAGANSLKIEGRNRNAQYVGAVTSAYKTARDFYFSHVGESDFESAFSNVKTELMSKLASVFNRGFSDGFFMGKPVGDWTSEGNEALKRKAIVGHITNYFAKAGVAEISVDDVGVREGDQLEVEGSSTGYFSFVAKQIRADGAPAEFVRKGSLFSVKVPEKVRRGDRLYKMI